MVIKSLKTKRTLVLKNRERRLKSLDYLKKERKVGKFGTHRTYQRQKGQGKQLPNELT